MNITRHRCNLEGPPHHQHSDLHSGRFKGLRWIKRKAPRWEFVGLPTYFWFILRWVIYGWPFGPLGFFAWTIDPWLVRPLRHGWKIRVWSWSTQTFGNTPKKSCFFFERHLQEILSTKWHVLQWFIKMNQYCINYPEIIIIATFTSLVCRIYMSCILSERKTYEKIIYWHDFSFASLTSIAEVSSETFSQQCEVFSGCLLWLSIFSFEVIDVCFLKNMFLEWIERVYSFFWPVLQHEYKPIYYIRLKQLDMTETGTTE